MQDRTGARGWRLGPRRSRELLWLRRPPASSAGRGQPAAASSGLCRPRSAVLQPVPRLTHQEGEVQAPDKASPTDTGRELASPSALLGRPGHGAHGGRRRSRSRAQHAGPRPTTRGAVRLLAGGPRLARRAPGEEHLPASPGGWGRTGRGARTPGRRGPQVRAPARGT